MNIIFFGTSNFAIPALKKVMLSHHELKAVVTQPDRRSGRKLVLTQPPVKSVLKGTSIPIYQPEYVSSQETVERLKIHDADLFVVVEFGQILKANILSAPKLFCINIHASLLPAYRGAAPINWSIINGEKESGITIIRMNEKMDAGDILSQEKVKIEDGDTSESLSKKLSIVGSELILKTIDVIDSGKAKFRKQKESSATYARKLRKEDGLIDWSMDARDIYNSIRGLLPWPGAYTHWNGKFIKIFKADLSMHSVQKKDVGRVVKICKDSLIIGTGKGGLIIKELQLQGGKRLDAGAFLLGHKIDTGSAFN